MSKRTRLFHTVVIVGSGLLASCVDGAEANEPPPAPVKRPDAGVDAAAPTDATPPKTPKKPKAPPPKAPRIMRQVPPWAQIIDPVGE